MFMAARKGSGEFFRVKGLSKIALRTGVKRGLFISLCDCAGAEKSEVFDREIGSIGGVQFR
jgi:hypothetical protein